MLGEEPPNPAEPCHSHLPGSPLKALPIFRASPESRPPTKKWSGSRAGVIYIHSQARGSGHPRGTGNRLGGQGPGCGHHHGTGRGPAQRGLQNPLWPVGKEGLPLVVPEAHTGPRCLGGGGELWTRAMAGCGAAGAGGRSPVVEASESQRPGRLRAGQHPGRDPAGGRPPGAGEGRSAPSHYRSAGAGRGRERPSSDPSLRGLMKAPGSGPRLGRWGFRAGPGSGGRNGEWGERAGRDAELT